MNMEPFEVYRYYLALRLHFTTDQYDAFKSHGKVRVTRQAFNKRKDLLAIKKVAETYSDQDVVNFLVANFTSGDRWGGVFDTEAKHRFTDWKRKMESMSYTFSKEVGRIKQLADKLNKSFSDMFLSINNQHPYVVKLYLRHDISIETLTILNKLEPFTVLLDRQLQGDILWPDLSRIIKKYEPFITIDQEKYGRLLRSAAGLD